VERDAAATRAAAARLEAAEQEARKGAAKLAELARAQEAAEEEAQQARHALRLTQGEAAAAQVRPPGVAVGCSCSRRRLRRAQPGNHPSDRLLIDSAPARPHSPPQEHLAQLKGSLSEAKARLEAQFEASKDLASQLEDARERLRGARAEAEEAVAEAEDARSECGRVLRELAGVHQVGASCVPHRLPALWASSCGAGGCGRLAQQPAAPLLPPTPPRRRSCTPRR
jgi:hypothetical protein